MSELKIIQQHDVTFYEDELTAVLTDDRRVFVSLTQMCNALGIDPATQRTRLRDHDVLGEGMVQMTIDTPGGPQKVYMLHADLVPLWLAGVRVRAVKPEVRGKLKRYQVEAAKVLWEAFQEGRLTADPLLDDLLSGDSDAVQAYKMLQALVKLARNQILLESQLHTHTTQIADHDERLENIEMTLGDTGRLVTPDQASQISQAVKAVAIALGKRSGRNEFGGIYGELYRRFGITGYKQLPARRFEEAMTWLNQWREEIEGDGPF
jgi:ferritin-like metal-binding protein YciE